MQVGILGPLEVDGAPLDISPKQRALVVALVLARARHVPDERLIDILWPRRPPKSASHALQVYVSELRKAGFEIAREDGGYRLSAPQLDADEFERLVAAGHAEAEAGRHETALASLDRALKLWRGPPLTGLEDDGGARAESSRLEELRISALEDRAESTLALGATPELRELESLVGEYPLRERLRGLYMLALYRAGRQADALEAFADARTALDELGLEPGAELRSLQRAILGHDAALAVEPEGIRRRRHLPAPATALVGRRAEIDAVTALLRGDTRLVTLTGPGGAGKTRLGLRAAYELADAFAHGVWFVGLASLVDPALVRPTIASALELSEESLLEELGSRELLLLLDNFEQLLEAAPLVSELLQAAPRLRVLTTSRAPLRVYGEHEFAVPPLPAGEAEELFRVRAQAAGRDLADRHLVSEICERLDRLPLALELVAARTAELMPDELLASLERRLELASRGARDLPERQRTLRAAIGWSHGLLDPVGRRLLVRLGVFAGGFTREAVAAVCGEDGGALGSLVEGNLVRRADDGRYRMLQVIREYALEQLSVDDEASAVRRRHAEHYAAMGEELVTALPGAGVEEAYASFEREHDNFRAALAFTRTPDLVELRLRLAAAVSHFWLVRGHLAEGRTWLDETLRLAQGHDMAPALHAALLRKLATLEWRQGDFDPADENAETALALLAGEVDENERWRLLILLGCIAYSRRESGRAGDWWQQSVDLARSLENDAHLSLALANLAVVLFERDDFRGAAGIYDESVDAARRADHREYLANALMGLGDARIRLGQYEEGRARLLESLDLYTKLGFHDRVASNCVWLAPAFEQDEDHATAARLLGAASGVRRRTGASLDWQEQEYLDALVSRLRAAAGSDVFEPAFGAGEAAPEDVVREVLSGSRPPS